MEAAIEYKGKKPGAIDNFSEFEVAVKNAAFEGQDRLEVSKRFFDKLAKGSAGGKHWITYGHPGVLVYCEGFLDAFEKEQLMDVFDHYEMEIKNKPKKGAK